MMLIAGPCVDPAQRGRELGGFVEYRGCARRARGGHFGRFGAPFGHGGGLGGINGRYEARCLRPLVAANSPSHLKVDSVKQDVRCNDNHLGRSVGMIVVGQGFMFVAPHEWL
jgi:hypothetical protein